MVAKRGKQSMQTSKSKAPQTVSLDAVCEALNLKVRRIHVLVKEGIIPPPVERGRYDLVGCMRGYIRFLQKGETGDALTAHRTRQARARADMLEMERAQLAGELVPLEQVARAWAQVLTTLRTLMLAVPAQLAARIGMVRSAVEAQALMRKEIEKVLEQASITPVAVDQPSGRNPSRSRRDDPAGLADSDAAADADDLAMG
jgi:phage terminase Nu1 subunit (DNA packaging protein)